MKPLIRPFLIAVARLGFFLAVVAWIIGQWWMCSLTAGLFNATATTDLSTRGINIRFSTFRAIPWSAQATRTPSPEQIQFLEYAFDETGAPLMGIGVETSFHTGIGFVYTNNGFMRIIAIRHWLIVSVFFAFNLALHFIYRKRPEAESCED